RAFFFSGRRRHTRFSRDWSSDVCSSDLGDGGDTDDIPITSFRIDQIPGTHVVKYASDIDDIEIKHTAHSREGFALGAVMVAEWRSEERRVGKEWWSMWPRCRANTRPSKR